MKKMITGVLVFLTVVSLIGETVPAGKVLEGLKFDSKILAKTVNYVVYLPPDYEASARNYPVVFLLHGFTDQEWAWIQFGEVNLAADRAIVSRTIPPMIIVMPDGGVTWYMNDYSGKVQWEDMFIQEFIPHIDSEYRTRSQKEFRGIAGLSMGGFGALLQAMKHPDQFAACVAFSSGVRTDVEIMERPNDDYDWVYGNIFGKKLRGDARLSEHYRANNPLDLAKTLPEKDLKSVQFFIDCGDDDFLIRGNCMLHLTLKDRGIPHEFIVRDGVHNWEYWRTGITNGLKFIGQSFHR